MIGPRDGMVVTGTLRSAKEHSLPHEVLSAGEVQRRFPAFNVPDDLVAVLDPRAGYLDPEACNKAHLAGAAAAGAEIRFDEPILQWTPDGEGAEVTTSAGRYQADQILVSAGAWNRRIVHGVDLPLSIERQSVFWFEPAVNVDRYDANQFPIYAYEFKPGTICYGFPRLPRGVKASVMHDGQFVADPDSVDRSVSDSEAEPLRAALRPILPELASATIREKGVCLFTNTPDHDFIIDFHPLYPQVLVSSPCSGHGFKFASAIGEVQADLLTRGESRFDFTPFRLARWPRGDA